MLKKIISFILLFSIVLASSLTLFVKNTKAQILNPVQQVGEFKDMWSHTWYAEPNPFNWYNKVYNPDTPESEIFGERYTAAQVQWVVYSLVFLPLNFIPGFPELATYCLQGDIIKCGETASKILDGLNPITDASIDTSRPLVEILGRNQISGIYYINDLISKFSVVQTVNAQGFGYNTAANSLKSVWSATRNISYGFIVIATMILSFMIMFQIKINPQTVISIQSAIPKIITSTILITFSYAIAGFAIDLMYVVIGLLAMLLSGSGMSGFSAIELFEKINTLNVFKLMYSYWVVFVKASFSVAGEGDGLGVLVFILSIISIIAIFFWSLKILMVVVKNFALLIITIITGPLEIMLGIITQSTGFGTWIKKLISYLAFYPVLITMFFLAFFFLNQGGNTLVSFDEEIPFNPVKDMITSDSWQPPLSSITGGSYSLTWIIVSFVIFSEITKISELIQSFISGKQWAYGHGINETLESSGGTLASIGSALPSTARAGGILKGAGAVLSALSKGI